VELPLGDGAKKAFRSRVLAKAAGGCKVRFLFVHSENPLLRGLLYNEKILGSVIHDINESFDFYSELAAKDGRIAMRQIKVGIPHFSLTQADRYAVLTQYLSSPIGESNPTWRCEVGSPLFEVAAAEFERLWNAQSKSSVRGA
jgi:hypothetical protein